MNVIWALLLLSPLCPGEASEEHPWRYHGKLNENHWGDTCAKGRHQSPIDIDDGDLTYQNLGTIVFHNYNGWENEPVEIENNGHTVKFSFPGLEPHVTTHWLKWRKYQLQQIHFHWGRNDYMGSEHTVNKERLSLEMHAVHKDLKTGKLLVIAQLFRATEDEMDPENVPLGILLDAVQNLGNKNKTTKNLNLDKDFYDKLFDLENAGYLAEYCTYLGSLTTPPCTEGVIWIINNEIGRVKEERMKILRKQKANCADGKNCRKKEGLSNNFRSTNPLNDRRVTCNKNTSGGYESNEK